MKIQTKALSILLVLTMILGLTACGSGPNQPNSANTSKPPAEGKANASAGSSETTAADNRPEKREKTTEIKIKVTVSGHVLTATLIDNATTRSLISKFPLTVPMMDLYSREMCYRFSEPLPANDAQQGGYEVGDLSYWTPSHSLVIFYKQNGEVISNLQKIGHFDSSVEFFKQTGNVDVKFELLDK